MNKIDFKEGGFPLNTDTLVFMQETYSKSLEALAAIGGDNYILTGCTGDVAVSDGYVVINGELLPFKGGTKQDFVRIEENVDAVKYETPGSQDTYFTRWVEFGTKAEANRIAWASLVRIDNLQKMASDFTANIANHAANSEAHPRDTRSQKAGDYAKLDADNVFNSRRGRQTIRGPLASLRLQSDAVAGSPINCIEFAQSDGKVISQIEQGNGASNAIYFFNPHGYGFFTDENCLLSIGRKGMSANGTFRSKGSAIFSETVEFEKGIDITGSFKLNGEVGTLGSVLTCVGTNGKAQWTTGNKPIKILSGQTYVPKSTDKILVLTNNSTVKLPASPAIGEEYIIKSRNPKGIIISYDGTILIEGLTNFAIYPGNCYSILYTGTEWIITGDYV